jgi:hypothetical protein
MLKILSSKVTVDSYFRYKPAVKFFACLDLERKSSVFKRLPMYDLMDGIPTWVMFDKWALRLNASTHSSSPVRITTSSGRRAAAAADYKTHPANINHNIALATPGEEGIGRGSC